jgi:3D (Asp-Asp-Asp) domain-containing protein
LSKLEKWVCATYICLAIVLGGLSAYFKVVLNENNDNYITKKDNNESHINSQTNSKKVLSDMSKIPIKAELTAYCNCSICSEAWGSQTAMQTHTKIGVVAVPKDIPLGSKIYIPELENYKEDGIFSAEDRGGAVVVKRDGTYIIDVWLPTHEQVKAFGRKSTTVYIIK